MAYKETHNNARTVRIRKYIDRGRQILNVNNIHTEKYIQDISFDTNTIGNELSGCVSSMHVNDSTGMFAYNTVSDMNNVTVANKYMVNSVISKLDNTKFDGFSIIGMDLSRLKEYFDINSTDKVVYATFNAGILVRWFDTKIIAQQSRIFGHGPEPY